MRLLSDSTKKFAILVPTAVLPRTWRVSARRKLLANHELAKARKADLLIIAHPKSGNTWLKVMLSRLYQIRYGLPASVIVTSDELARRNADIPRIVATNGCYSYECAVGDRLQASAPDNRLRHKPVLFLPRHPADIAVSWYFQFTKRQSAPKQELINHAIAHPIDRRTISLWDFVRHSDIGLPFLIQYLNAWERNMAHLDRSLMVRYEELRGTPEAAIRKIVDFYGASFTDDEIRQAVEFGSFDNLRQLESKGFFRQGGLTLRNPSDPESFKVRRGKVGGYRDYFSPAQLEELDGLIDETLSPTLGYTMQDQGMPIRAVN
ncbi:MAG: sulfotransferase domain-containing protein [Hyphomicrobiales bacterium]|nr:sulfotransferase domain-containing protein [Hyphomicrobiales bacterium]